MRKKIKDEGEARRVFGETLLLLRRGGMLTEEEKLRFDFAQILLDEIRRRKKKLAETKLPTMAE